MSAKLILKTCRVCLDEKGSISVFERNSDDLQYSTQIMDCVNITVEADDPLPKMLCVQCVCDLETAHRFVRRCAASDIALRSRLLAPAAEDVADCSSPPIYDSIKEEYDEQEKELYTEPDGLKCKKKPKKKVKRQKTGPIQCVVCGYMAQSRSAMETHMRSHTGEKPYQCHKCLLHFATKGGMTRHINNNHQKRERRFTCETCGNSFFTKSDIITHMRIHTDEKPYTCSICSKKFRQSASLIRHRRTHSGEKPFACPVCGKCFSDKDLVRKHQSVHSDEKKFSCSVCNKSMKTRTALKTHMILHSNEKCNVCSFCGLAFAMKGNLQMHVQRMHSEKSGQCSVCMKTFPDLETHMRKHTGERPFACSLCKQTYSTKRSLARHIAFKHENAAKFKCSIGECLRSFPTAMMLEFHLLKHHTNHTPFVCAHCARGFYRNSDLSRHLKISHMEVPLKLPVKNLIH